MTFHVHLDGEPADPGTDLLQNAVLTHCLVPAPPSSPFNSVGLGLRAQKAASTASRGAANALRSQMGDEKPNPEQAQGRRESGNASQGAATATAGMQTARNHDQCASEFPSPQITFPRAAAFPCAPGRNPTRSHMEVSPGSTRRISWPGLELGSPVLCATAVAELENLLEVYENRTAISGQKEQTLFFLQEEVPCVFSQAESHCVFP